MRRLFLTLFYSGLSPFAPGTVGTAVALVFAMILLLYIDVSTLFLLAFLIGVIAVKQIDAYEKEGGEHDNKEIVIDELVGMWIAISICGINQDNFFIMSALSFIYFRIFDIWKPSIIGRIDKNVKGGWGVMGDDMLAGIFAGICTAATYMMMGKFVF